MRAVLQARRRAVREHDDILQRRALDRAGEGNVGCLFDLHVGPPGLRSFDGTPTSARTRGRATMDREAPIWQIQEVSALWARIWAHPARHPWSGDAGSRPDRLVHIPCTPR